MADEESERQGVSLSFEDALGRVRGFRDARGWSEFHNPKDLAISISLEAAELLELFQWSGGDVDVPQRRDRMKEEVADVMIYCMQFADAIGADIPQIIVDKLAMNASKYPVPVNGEI